MADSDKNEDKGEVKSDANEEIKLPPTNFLMFLMSLVSSAQVHLGIFPNPATNKNEVSLQMAKYTIDTLGMLQEKTKGNLTDEEQKTLDQFLSDLRLLYVEQEKNAKGA